MASAVQTAEGSRIYPQPESAQRVQRLLSFSPLSSTTLQNRISFLGKIAEGSMLKPPTEAAREQRYTLGLLGLDLTTFDNAHPVQGDFSGYQEDLLGRYEISTRHKKAKTMTQRSAALLAMEEFIYTMGLTIGDLPEDEPCNFVTRPELMQALATRIASVETLKDAPKDPRISPMFQESFLATEITCATVYALEQLAKLSKDKEQPEVMHTFLTLLDTENTFRQTFQDILTRNQPRERFFLLDFFNRVAEDSQIYAVNTNPQHVQTNKVFLGQVLHNHPEFAQAIQDAQERAVTATNRAIPSTEPQDETRPALMSLFSPEEQLRVQLINQLTDVPSFIPDTTSTAINKALAALASPHDASSSPLAIAKTYLLEHDSNSNEDNMFTLRWILRQALEVNPDLFGPLATQLREYLATTTPTWKTDQYTKISHTAIEQMLARQQGEPLDSNNVVRERFTSGAPFIFDFSHTAFGDALLSLPMLYDVAKVFQMRPTPNAMTLVVSKSMHALAAKIFEDFSFIEVISQTKPKTKREQAQFTRDTKDLFRQKATGPNGEKGVILTYAPPFDLELYEEGFAQGALYIPPLPEVISEAEAAQWNTFRRRQQAQFSWLFQTVMFDPEHRDDISGIQKKLEETTIAYLAQRPEQQEEINKIKAHHTGGYIVVIDKGSTKEKQLTPSAVNAMLDMLTPFCHDNDMAVVLLHSQTFDTTVTPTTKRGVPVYETGISREFAHTFTWLQSAKATIGPDTFLTHVAEFFPHPVLNLHIDSHPVVWSVDDKVKWALFAFARGLLEENIHAYLPEESEWYRQKLLHPFTLLGSKNGRRKPLHPLIYTVQKAFEEEIARAMEELTSLI